MKSGQQNILYSWYCVGYKDAIEGKKSRIFKFNSISYFTQDIIWAYERGYAAGLTDRKKLEINHK